MILQVTNISQIYDLRSRDAGVNTNSDRKMSQKAFSESFKPVEHDANPLYSFDIVGQGT